MRFIPQGLAIFLICAKAGVSVLFVCRQQFERRVPAYEAASSGSLPHEESPEKRDLLST
jgi:hypothetical protein